MPNTHPVCRPSSLLILEYFFISLFVEPTCLLLPGGIFRHLLPLPYIRCLPFAIYILRCPLPLTRQWLFLSFLNIYSTTSSLLPVPQGKDCQVEKTLFIFVFLFLSLHQLGQQIFLDSSLKYVYLIVSYLLFSHTLIKNPWAHFIQVSIKCWCEEKLSLVVRSAISQYCTTYPSSPDFIFQVIFNSWNYMHFSIVSCL